KRSSRAWVSCTSRSSSTGCCVSSKSTPTSAARKSPTKRPSSAKCARRAVSSARPAGGGRHGTARRRLRRARPPTAGSVTASTKGGVVPGEYIAAVEKGAREGLEGGVLAGYPMVDVQVGLLDGSAHEVDSSEMAFKIAASMALKDGARKASPVLLEPVMSVEVV